MFYYNLDERIDKGYYIMELDTSIMFKYASQCLEMLDYTISLGGNPRFLLDLYCENGKCGPLRSFMAGVDIKLQELELPPSKKGTLYYSSNEQMSQYSGEIYMMCHNNCCYDERKGILCIGDFEQLGECIEFVENTIAVVKGSELVAIYVKVNNIKEYKVLSARGCIQFIPSFKKTK